MQGYLFGKPVSAGAVRVTRAEDRGYWSRKKKSEPVEQSSILDEHGDAELQLDVKDDFAEFNGNDYECYRDIKYRAIVTDTTTGRTEPRNFTVRLTRYRVHIYLYELGGSDHEGDYIVSTTYGDGEPVSARLPWIGWTQIHIPLMLGRLAPIAMVSPGSICALPPPR